MAQTVDYEHIMRTVINMHIEYGSNKIPFDICEMASSMNIELIPYSTLANYQQIKCLEKSKDGFSIGDSRAWKIFYNDYIGCEGRIRFTIMHEIGHYQLGHLSEDKMMEVEANFFAKYALAPPPLIHQLKKIDVYAISKTFCLSMEAALFAYRYYKNWLMYGAKDYTIFERKLLKHYNVA